MFTKAFWLTLISRSSSFVEATHPHIVLLKEFLASPPLRARSGEGQENVISFAEWLTFAASKGLTQSAMTQGKAARLFQTLAENRPYEVGYCEIDSIPILYRFKDSKQEEIDSLEIDFETFTYVQELGHGTNGIARLYRSANGKCIVVKSPTHNQTKESFLRRCRDIEFMHRLYPQDGRYFINHLQHGDKQDFYAISPYVTGSDFRTFCQEQTSYADLLETLIAVAEELQRIHAEGIIHGDVHSSNLRLWRDPATRKIQVRFFDFEWGNFTNEQMLLAPIPDDHFWAPERNVLNYPQCVDESFEFKIPNAAPTIDIYSTGRMIEKMLETTTKFKLPPNLAHLLRQCRAQEPDTRPALQTLLTELYKEQSRLGLSTTAQFMRQGIAGKERVVCDTFYEETRISLPKPKEVIDSDFIVTVDAKQIPASVIGTADEKKGRCIIM